MKTRVNSNIAQQTNQNLNISNYIEITSKGFSRGLWLLWFNKAIFHLGILHTHN